MLEEAKDTTAETTALPPREQLRVECLMLCASAASLDAKTLDDWVRELERFDAVGCMFSPTEWIHTAKAREVSLKMLRAIAAFKRALEVK